MIQSFTYNYSKLKGLIRERNLTQEDVASAISLNKSTFNQKLKGKSEFRQSEILAICNFLEISLENISTYFFAIEVRNKQT